MHSDLSYKESNAALNQWYKRSSIPGQRTVRRILLQPNT